MPVREKKRGKQGLSQNPYECCVHACLRVALGCVDALQSGAIVPIVAKVRGLIKNVWISDISHLGDGQESYSLMLDCCSVCIHLHVCVMLSIFNFFLWDGCVKISFKLFTLIF